MENMILEGHETKNCDWYLCRVLDPVLTLAVLFRS